MAVRGGLKVAGKVAGAIGNKLKESKLGKAVAGSKLGKAVGGAFSKAKEKMDDFKKKSFFGKVGSLTKAGLKYGTPVGLLSTGLKAIGNKRREAKKQKQLDELTGRLRAIKDTSSIEPLKQLLDESGIKAATKFVKAREERFEANGGKIPKKSLMGKLKGIAKKGFDKTLLGTAIKHRDKIKKAAMIATLPGAIGAGKSLFDKIKKSKSDNKNEAIINAIKNSKGMTSDRKAELLKRYGIGDSKESKEQQVARFTGARASMPQTKTIESERNKKYLKKEIGKQRDDTSKASETSDLLKKQLEMNEKMIEALTNVSKGMDKVADNTGTLSDIKTGLDSNLKEATKPSVINNVTNNTKQQVAAPVQPTIQVSKQKVQL